MNETLLSEVELHYKVLFGGLEGGPECKTAWESVSEIKDEEGFCAIVEIIEYFFY